MKLIQRKSKQRNHRHCEERSDEAIPKVVLNRKDCCVIAFLAMTLVWFIGCADSSDIFPDLSTNVASPLTVTIDAANSRAYLNNSNVRVEYDATQGSVHVLDLTPLSQSPAAKPTRVGDPVVVQSFSAEMVLDSSNSRLLIANRYSADEGVTSDQLLSFNTSSLAKNDPFTFATALDPFGMAVDTTNNRLLVTSPSDDLIQYFDLSAATLTGESLSLINQTMRNSSNDTFTLTRSRVTHVTARNNQAFVSRENAGVFVLDLNELTNKDISAVDHFIFDIANTRGIAIENNDLYVLSRESEDGRLVSRLFVLDVSSLTTVADNSEVNAVDKDDILTVQFKTGSDTDDLRENDPQEIVIGQNYIFTSNQDSDSISVFQKGATAADLTRLDDIAVGEEPFGLAILQNQNGTLNDSSDDTDQFLFVCNVLSNTVSIIDISGDLSAFNASSILTYP